MSHISVLLHESIEALVPKPVKCIIDGTLGAGGHSRALLEAGAAEVLAFDLDPQAIAIAQKNLAEFGNRIHIVHDSYMTMAKHAADLGWESVDGILLDLGVSSMQFDTPERGFAFRFDAPLDMRFNTANDEVTAAYIVNTWAEDALSRLFFRYGEEPHSKRIAKAIVQARPFETTQQLADVVAKAIPAGKKGKIHPATLVFQALRIAVNDELQTIEKTLPIAIDMLKSGGRLAVISFHSLEDRIVKQFFKEASTEIIAPPGMASIEEKAAIIKLVTRKPIEPSEAEIMANPRSRSSKLRVVEKL
jgi:16S rRNA (cytosine1402-N4)-methyltransferase